MISLLQFKLLCWTLLIGSKCSTVAGLPSGFVETDVGQVPGGVDTNFAYTEDGYLVFGARKAGEFFVFEENRDQPGTYTSTLALDLANRICTVLEEGLVGVVAHPNFAQNRWVYLYYTHKGPNGSCQEDAVSGPHNRLSRFVLRSDNTVDPSSEVVVLRTAPVQTGYHHSGDMAFGKDGFLYVTIGDNGLREVGAAQQLDNLWGTVVRITDEGGIPPNNPFLDVATSAPCAATGVAPSGKTECQEIYNYGLRNPFRFAMDPNTQGTSVRFLIGDVGGGVWEEIDEGGHETAGQNYGYPVREGPCRFGSKLDCDVVARFADPLFWYQHPPKDGPLEGGACVVGVAIPENGLWPPEYDNSFFYIEFVEQKIYYATPDSENACRTCTPPRPAYKRTFFADYFWGVGMQFGPYYDDNGVMQNGALYVLGRRSSPTLKRITYVGGSNRAPTARAVRQPEGPVPLGSVVSFDASSSSDPDGNTLTFDWKFGDDGSSDIIDGPATVQHAYSAKGTYEVVVTAKDGETSSDFRLTVSVGTPPTATIISPAEGTQFAVGDVFVLHGTGMDSDGNSLPVSSLSWEVRQVHNVHFHPFLSPQNGDNITISPAPEPEDFEASTNSFLEVHLTVTDADGLQTTAIRNIMPTTIQLDFDTEPTGLQLSLDEALLTMPQDVLSWENHNLRLYAPNQDIYVFDHWEHGGGRRQKLKIPANTPSALTTYTAVFRVATPTISPAPTLSPTLVPTDAPVTPTTSPTSLPTSTPTLSPSSGPTAAKADPVLPANAEPGAPPTTSGAKTLVNTIVPMMIGFVITQII